MFIGEEYSCFGILPPELLVKILQFVGKRLNVETRVVCRRWQFINDHPDSGLSSFRAGFIKYQKLFEDFLISERQFENLYIGGKKTDWPSRLTLSYFPAIRSLVLGKALSGKTALAILEAASTFLEVLQILESSMTYVDTKQLATVLSNLKWDNLSELRISVVAPSVVPHETTRKTIEPWFVHFDETHSAAIETFLDSAMIQNLKIFVLVVQPCPSKYPVLFKGIGPKFATVVSKYTKFIERHAKTLKNITFHMNVCVNKEFCALLPILTEDRQESGLELQSLQIYGANIDSLYLVPPCVFLSDKLKLLKWSPTFEMSTSRLQRPVDRGQFQALILRNLASLVRLDTTLNPDYFRLEWLKGCPYLRDLTVSDIFKVLAQTPEVRLPQITSLTMDIEDTSELFGHISAWIARQFKNLIFLKVTGLTAKNDEELENSNGHCDWLENFLNLMKLQEVRYSFGINWSDFQEEVIAIFCRKTSRLRYVREGFIKVTPAK